MLTPWFPAGIARRLLDDAPVYSTRLGRLVPEARHERAEIGSALGRRDQVPLAVGRGGLVECGIVAVEPFDYVPDGPGAAARAIGYVRGLLEALQ